MDELMVEVSTLQMQEQEKSEMRLESRIMEQTEIDNQTVHFLIKTK